MKHKVLTAIALLLCCAYSLNAEEAASSEEQVSTGGKDSKFFISAQGGVAFSINENCSAFFQKAYPGDNKRHPGNLFQGEGAINIGYYFTPRWGLRLTGEWGQNASAANYRENNKIFNPYYFNSCLLFADVIVNGGKVSVPKAFNWRLFAGIGYAHSHKFTQHNIAIATGEYVITDPNNCFAFRFGFQLEHVFRCGVGIFFEGCHEWMTDNFNGYNPTDSTTGNKTSFPFDTKLNNSIGVSYHF